MGQVRRIAAGLLLLWLAVLPSARGAAPSGREVRAALQVRVAVPLLVLGQDRAARLSVDAPPEVTLEQLALRASAGEVRGLRREGPGRFSATYHAPTVFYPQVALISAVAPSGESLLVGHAALPLWGQGEAEVRTQPLTEVRVRIGKQPFGPVRADQRGRAQVKVVVPPGTAYGWDGPRKVDLQVPPTQRLYARAEPERYVGVSGQRITVLLFVVDDQGRASSAVHPAAPDSVVGLREIGVGAFAAELEAAPGPPGDVAVTCSLPGAVAGAAQVRVRRLAGPPARLVLRAPAATGNAPVTLRLGVEDALGTAVDASGLAVAASAGSADPVRRSGPGAYATTFRPPARGSGRATVELRATADGGLAAETRVTVSYPVPPPPPRGVRSRWFWSAAGVSAALLVSGIVTRAVALDKSAEYKDPATTIPRRRELKDAGEPLTTYSTVALTLGAAAAAGAAVLWFFTDFRSGGVERAPHQGAALLPTDGGAQVLFRRTF
jgi:hypothetical protein